VSFLTLTSGIVAVLLLALASMFWLILRDAMSKEAAAVIPERTRSLIARAKDRLPEEARPRWEEEWPAGFAEAIEKRPVWALREAISLYRGARRIAAELEPAVASAGRDSGVTSPTSSPFAGMTSYARLIARLRRGFHAARQTAVTRSVAWILNASNAIWRVQRTFLEAVNTAAPPSLRFWLELLAGIGALVSVALSGLRLLGL
jgi:hypothetical protein